MHPFMRPAMKPTAHHSLSIGVAQYSHWCRMFVSNIVKQCSMPAFTLSLETSKIPNFALALGILVLSVGLCGLQTLKVGHP